jgi:hypothetical protein
MSADYSINFISKKLELSDKQIKLLRKLPEGYWVKCTKAIKVSKNKNYPLKVRKKGLLENKPNPIVDFIHTYNFIHRTRELKHTISIEISV